MTRYRKHLVGLSIILCFLVCGALGGRASALGATYFDDANGGQCDVSDCTKTEVRLDIGQTRFVHQQEDNVIAYFTSPTGTVDIANVNYCPKQLNSTDGIQTGDWIDQGTNYTDTLGKSVSMFEYLDASGNVLAATDYGNAHDAGSAACDNVRSTTFNNLPKVPGIVQNLYYVIIKVSPIDQAAGVADGIHNTFYITASGGTQFAVANKDDTPGSGNSVTVQETKGPDNQNYFIRFGTDCSVKAPVTKQLTYFDIDNDGGAGAQLNGKVSMGLRDVTDNTWLQDSGSFTANLPDWTAGDNASWQPASNNGATGARSFTATPNHKYVWVLENVYINNTIQFGTPFDGINALTTCSPPVTPPANMSCGMLSTVPAAPGPNSPTSLSMAVNYTSSSVPAASDYRLDATVSGTGLNQSYANVPRTAASTSSSVYTQSGVVFPAPGTYTVNWTYSGVGIAPLVCSGEVVVTSKPFFNARGGDVVAGASFVTDVGTPCGSSVATAGIVGWNREAAPAYAGAGGQYAAIAMGLIQDFVTDQGNANPVGSTLSFANVNDTGAPGGAGSIGTGLFGGMFGGAPCADYWSQHPTTPYDAQPSGPVGGWASGIYYLDSTDDSLILNPGVASSTLPPDRHITVYVKGDVSIAGNIVYPPDTTVYSSQSQIPSFKLIVSGVIYIDKSVTTLDGFYAAIPDAGAATSLTTNPYQDPRPGTISTCSHGFDSYDPTITGDDVYFNCAAQLTFNGAVVAHHIWLLRSYGDLWANTPGAEIFNYVPDIWLAPSGSGSGGGYQSVVGLPPNL